MRHEVFQCPVAASVVSVPGDILDALSTFVNCWHHRDLLKYLTAIGQAGVINSNRASA